MASAASVAWAVAACSCRAARAKIGGLVGVIIVIIVIGTRFLGRGRLRWRHRLRHGIDVPGNGRRARRGKSLLIPAGEDRMPTSGFLDLRCSPTPSRSGARPSPGMAGAGRDAQLVLYSGAVSTGGCGNATSAVGPSTARLTTGSTRI